VEWDLAPFGLALHGDRAQGVGGMSAELVTSGGDIAQDDTFEIL
jgi:hypothetical protein